MIIQKLLNGAILGIVQKKIVETLVANKQFRQMSIQFKDKLDEITGEKPMKKRNHNINKNNNHHHSGAHSNHIGKNTFSSQQQIKYTDDIHENQRIYERQQRLQQQQKNEEYQEMKDNQQQQYEDKNFISHLFDGFKEEFKSEVDKLNGKKKK